MEIKKEITINASAARVFKAITDPKQITKWFPDIESIDPRIGGKVSFKFLDFDTNNRNNKDRILEGKITELQKDKKLVYTWGHSDTPESPITQVTWILEEIETRKTRVTITHTGFLDEISMKPYNEQWDWLAERLNAFAESKKRIDCSWKQLFALFSSFFCKYSDREDKACQGKSRRQMADSFCIYSGRFVLVILSNQKTSNLFNHNGESSDSIYFHRSVDICRT